MKKILIVDDRVEIRDLVDVTLKSDNYEIIKAASGEEAVETALKEQPDLVDQKDKKQYMQLQ